MNREQVIVKVREILERMNCTDIVFPDPKDDLVVATFNCTEVTSFVAQIPEWTYSGIHLDPTRQRQYKIGFTKIPQT